MKAMILAAGRGDRMRPLTDSTPKPLLKVAGQALIDWHIKALVRAGVEEIIINHCWLGEQIPAHCGDGQAYGVHIRYSHEATALETAGGIRKALPLLGDKAFIVVNGDIWTDFDFAALTRHNVSAAHLVLVPNPPQHPQGDFVLQEGAVIETGEPCYTFSGIGLYHPTIFQQLAAGSYPLGKLLRSLMKNNLVSGEYYSGQWFDIGTPQRLEDINNQYSESANG